MSGVCGAGVLTLVSIGYREWFWVGAGPSLKWIIGYRKWFCGELRWPC